MAPRKPRRHRGVRIVPKGERRVRRGGVKIIGSKRHPQDRRNKRLYRPLVAPLAPTTTGLVHPLLPDLATYSVDVSVVFGTYNRFEHLKRCVESIRAACTNVTYEIVVGDGGSSDGSKEWLQRQPDVKYVAGGLDGAVAAFNACFREVSGRFVLTLNDDAVLLPDAVDQGLKMFADPMVGQVAFAFNEPHDQQFKVLSAMGYPYANYGMIRTNLARSIAGICGGLWAPVYRTYGGDNELSLWVLRLGYRIAPCQEAKVMDLHAVDSLRERSNSPTERDATGKLFSSRWSPQNCTAFRGPPPQMDAGTLAQLRATEKGEAPSVRWPRLESVDPEPGQLPPRTAMTKERVLQVFIQTADDPQQSMLRSFATMGAHGHVVINWLDYNKQALQQKISECLRVFRPTVVFFQFQRPEVIDTSFLKSIRQGDHDPSMVLLMWSGDVGEVNGPWPIKDGWSHIYSKHVDAMLYTGTGQVRMQQARGMTNAAYLQIGYDEDRYYPGPAHEYGVKHTAVFLGQNYGPQWGVIPDNDAQLRRDVVAAFQKHVVGFEVYGGGWSGRQPLPQVNTGDVYRKSLLGLSISLTSQLERYSSDRLFRIMACGTTPLVKRFADMEGLDIKHEKNALVWNTVDEAVSLAREWLRPERRVELLQIGARAAETAKQNHTWGVRMQELSAILKALRGQR